MRIIVTALVVAVACMPTPAASPSPVATATPTVAPTVALTASPSATPTARTAGVLSDRFGLVVGTQPPRVRSETDATYIATLAGEQLFSGAVSPDGRAIAYWATPSNDNARDLWVFDTRAAAPRRLLTLPETERAATSTGGGVAWSTDGKGLLIGVNSRDYAQGPPDQPHLYSTFRQVDVGTGSSREIVRKEPGHPFFPLAWDKARDLSVAVQWGGGGFVLSYAVVRGTTLSTPPGLPRATIHPLGMRASPDGTRMLASTFFTNEGRAAYVWPIEDPSRATQLVPAGRETVVASRWRNDREIVVSLSATASPAAADRLEVWGLDGTRRVVLSRTHRLDAVRPDGSAAIADLGVVDLTTGAVAVPPDVGMNPRFLASLVLR